MNHKETMPTPDVQTVAEETSSREVNTMLRDGWRLLAVIAAHDGAGGYPVYVVGKPRRCPVDAPPGKSQAHSL